MKPKAYTQTRKLSKNHLYMKSTTKIHTHLIKRCEVENKNGIDSVKSSSKEQSNDDDQTKAYHTNIRMFVGNHLCTFPNNIFLACTKRTSTTVLYVNHIYGQIFHTQSGN